LIAKRDESDDGHDHSVDAVRFGSSLRALRRHKRMRQRDLAAAAGCSQSLIARIEGGRGDVVTPRVLVRVAQAMGARVTVRLDWNGEGLDHLLDESHARIVEVVAHELVAAGWEVRAEATFAIYGERGSVDVLAWHPATGCLLVIEVKSVIADVQDTLASLARKVRLAERIAPQQWRARTVSVLLVVADTRTNRRRVEGHQATFTTGFPDRRPVIRRFLASPGSQPIRGLWFLPASTHGTTRQRVRRN
jgi:transcriptional regulator with XRE-family HTH domain